MLLRLRHFQSFGAAGGMVAYAPILHVPRKLDAIAGVDQPRMADVVLHSQLSIGIEVALEPFGDYAQIVAAVDRVDHDAVATVRGRASER